MKRSSGNSRRLAMIRIFTVVVLTGGLSVATGFAPMPADPSCTDVVQGEGWSFVADGPVHFEPVTAAGRAFFTSDDGHLYCVDDRSGKLKWKVFGGDSTRMMIDADSRRMISAWPARGGAAFSDGVVYFGAGLFTPTGVYVLAVHAGSGKVLWKKEVGSALKLFGSFQVGHVPLGRLSVSKNAVVVPTTGSSMRLSVRDGKIMEQGRYFKHHGGDDYVKKHSDHWHWSERWQGVEVDAVTKEIPGTGPVEIPEEMASHVKADGGGRGYAIVAGLDSGDLAVALAERTGMHVIVVDKSEKDVSAFREACIEKGLYGTRLEAHVGNPVSYPYPSGTARLMVASKGISVSAGTPLARAVHPERGVLFSSDGKDGWKRISREDLSAGKEKRSSRGGAKKTETKTVERDPGWTHGGANAGCTWMSFDDEVKPPLAVQWFGGKMSCRKTHKKFGARVVLQTYPMLVSGNVIYQRSWCKEGKARYGMGAAWWEKDRTSAFDLRTGEQLWETATAGGMEMVASPEGLYQGASTKTVKLLDSASGKTTATFEADGTNFKISGDLLFSLGKGGMAALDRHSGKVSWKNDSSGSLFVIGNDQVYVLDGSKIQVLESATGKELKTFTGIPEGNYLQYQPKADVVVVSQRNWDFGSWDDFVESRGSHFSVFDGTSGKLLWKNDKKVFFLNLTGEFLFNMYSHHSGGKGERFDVRTGANKMDFKTGKQCLRQFGGNEHLILYRAWNAACYDIRKNVQFSLGSFRSGCLNRMVVGEGVLVHPDDSYDCDCTWPLNTAVGFVPAGK